MGSRMHVRDIMNGPPLPYKDDIRANSKEYAQALDAKDPLRRFREEFILGIIMGTSFNEGKL